MNFAILTSAAIIGLSIASSHAADAPLPPRVNFIAMPASELRLGMTAQNVTRVMGDAASETDVTIGSTEISKLHFTDAIPCQVVLTDGKVSRITLDPFRMEKDALPSFSRQAWPGFAGSAVRRTLGEPAVVLRHQFFGIEVDQWIYSHDGDVSVFIRADRVIAKAAGRGVPSDLFRVDLPSPPDSASEGPPQDPQLGMTESDIRALYGAVKLQVDYSFNGRSASNAIYETRAGKSFAGFTFVDGVVTAFEDLGRLPDEIFIGP